MLAGFFLGVLTSGVAALALFLASSYLPNVELPVTLPSESTVADDNPLLGDTLYVDPSSSAADAVAGGASQFATLAETPTAIWLTPEDYPAATAPGQVAAIVADARAADAVPVFVIYGVPDRDCGNFSSGGTDDYGGWVSALSTGLAAGPSILILEPDALALSIECDNTAERVSQMQTAIATFADLDTTIYLDGGHSNWLPADQMAPLLLQAGIDRVRGFFTNVSNYNSTENEQAYAEELSSLTNGASFVIDVSRNGAGADGNWCNSASARLGQSPEIVSDSTPLDALLWIKVPGESDGTCNGGPAAGTWWPAAARQLLGG